MFRNVTCWAPSPVLTLQTCSQVRPGLALRHWPLAWPGLCPGGGAGGGQDPESPLVCILLTCNAVPRVSRARALSHVCVRNFKLKFILKAVFISTWTELRPLMKQEPMESFCGSILPQTLET